MIVMGFIAGSKMELPKCYTNNNVPQPWDTPKMALNT